MFRQTVLLHPPTRHTCDPIGNREEATEGIAETTAYPTNSLNQYKQPAGAAVAEPEYDGLRRKGIRLERGKPAGSGG
jgi:hypothetical protein